MYVPRFVLPDGISTLPCQIGAGGAGLPATGAANAANAGTATTFGTLTAAGGTGGGQVNTVGGSAGGSIGGSGVILASGALPFSCGVFPCIFYSNSGSRYSNPPLPGTPTPHLIPNTIKAAAPAAGLLLRAVTLAVVVEELDLQASQFLPFAGLAAPRVVTVATV